MFKINNSKEISLRELNQSILYSPEKLHNKFIYFEDTCIDYICFSNGICKCILRLDKKNNFITFFYKNNNSVTTYAFNGKIYIF